MGFLVGASTLIVLGQLNNVVGIPSTIGAATPEIIRSLLRFMREPARVR